MSQALTFNDVTLSPITHQNSLWIRAAELARALGYAQENSVSRLYRKNADEFTEGMTQVIEIPAESRNGSPVNLADGRCRVFSLRGCHLVAMFSRTPVAKAFRRWVLDVLDKLNEQQARAATTRPRRKNIADDIVPAPLTPEEARREQYRRFLERVEATRLDVTRQIEALRNDAMMTLLPPELWLQGDRLIATALTWLDTWLVKEVTSILPVNRKENETLLQLLMCAAYMPGASGRVFLK
mgnify:CR=1 FL=1